MHARAFLLCLLTATLCSAGEEEFRKRIAEAKEAGDDVTHEAAIAEWRAAEPKSPEPLISEANRLMGNSRGYVKLDQGQPEAGDFALKDPETGEVKGRITSGKGPHPETTDEILALLREALVLAPHRLDIRGGLAYICREAGRYDDELKVLTEMAKHALAHPAEQRWISNAALEMPVEEFVPDKLHSYGLYHYQQETIEGEKRFGAIAQLATECYPDAPIAWNDLALFRYLSQKDTKGAAECLEKAAKLAPDDRIVQFNLAHFYTELEEPAKAKAIYESILTNSKDERDVASAREKLEALAGTISDPDPR